MLKWTKHKDSDSMSRSSKFRPNGPTNSSHPSTLSNGKATMPSTNVTTSSPSSTTFHNNNNHNPKDTQNGSTGNSFSEMSDEASSSEADNGPITLDVELPSGKHMDIVVEYTTPMLDLLVSLAGKCKVNPSGLILQLLDSDTGQPLTYKPNQTIGALGGREVRLVPKENKSKNDRKKDTPFEMTHRFTMNLPRGQKTVVRVSPHITLGQLMTSVCEDKSLDLRRHILQIPGQPGVKVDLASTIQELGRHELNLVAVGLQDPRSHMVSMPDLSNPPPNFGARPLSNAPVGGELKKKRGFLSFLSKSKDKKYRQSMETSSTTSHVPRGPNPPATRQASIPPAQRRELSESPHRPNHPDTRPKSMFITAQLPDSGKQTNVESHSTQQQKHQLQQPLDITSGTGKKKRRAPAPPPPPAEDTRAQVHNGGHLASDPIRENVEEEEQQHIEQKQQHQQEQQQHIPRIELLSRLHSRNSSDSSGYHELPLSGAESPEAPGYFDHQAQHPDAGDQFKSSSASISSGLDGSVTNGDSGIHDLSPTRVSPIQEVSERSDPHVMSTETVVTVSAASGGGGGKKKRKAPAPPAPPSSQSQHPPESSSQSSTLDSQTPDIITAEPHLQAIVKQPAQTMPSPREEESSEEQTPRESTPRENRQKADKAHQDIADTIPPIAASAEISASEVTQSKVDSYQTEYDSDDDAADTNTAFDINDILEGVVFDEDPVPVELHMTGSRDGGDMVMEETDSIISETVEEQVETSRNERPCAFIPPPPPDEPPPPEVEPVTLTQQPEPVLVDKGTGVNDDNASLPPSSAKNSPGADHRKRRDSFTSLGSVDTIEGLSMDFEQAIQMGEESLYFPVDDVTVPSSYKSEMALFVERMSKMAVETTSAAQNDDSVSSLSLPASDNSDTGSVIQHVRTGSQDSRVSGSDSGGSLRGQSEAGRLKDKVCLPMSEEIDVPIETVPPPPEFGDEDKAGDKEEMDDEEYYRETVEELIVPLTPHGYDFSAAQKVATEETVESKPTPRGEENKDGRVRSGSTGVFRAEPVSIAPIPTASVSTPRPPTPPLVKQTSVPMVSSAPPKAPSALSDPKEKEEFILTLEDLDSISFLPPQKSKTARASSINNSETPVSPGFVSSAALVIEKQETSPRGRSTMATLSSKSDDSYTETKPLAYNQPRGGRVDKLSTESPHDSDLDPITNKLSPWLLVDSSSHSVPNKHRSDSDIAQRSFSSAPTAALTTFQTPAVEPDQVDAAVSDQPNNSEEEVIERPTETNNEVDPQEALATQYVALQSQFALWQTQLSQNQELLAAQTSPGQLQQLSDQVLVQQQMMQQLQQTMFAIQQQQKTEGKEPNSEPAVTTSLPTHQPPPPPPPPPPAPPTTVQNAPKSYGVIPKVRTLDSPRPAKQLTSREKRFEPVLDPREELMLAIRGFKGREGLRSVSVQQTKWVHSNR